MIIKTDQVHVLCLCSSPRSEKTNNTSEILSIIFIFFLLGNNSLYKLAVLHKSISNQMGGNSFKKINAYKCTLPLFPGTLKFN